jgi:hypothetical protein
MMKRRIYEKLSLYRESAQELLKEFENHKWPETVGRTFIFETYDRAAPGYDPKDPATWTPDKYKGRLLVEVDGDVPDEELDATLQAFVMRPAVSRQVDPPLWLKAWDFLTKTKG